MEGACLPQCSRLPLAPHALVGAQGNQPRLLEEGVHLVLHLIDTPRRERVTNDSRRRTRTLYGPPLVEDPARDGGRLREVC